MSNYEIVAIQNDEGFFWGVSENQTEQMIDTFFFVEDAQEYHKFLEKGGGFAGFTPSFMLRSVKVPENIDDSFVREFDLPE